MKKQLWQTAGKSDKMIIGAILCGGLSTRMGKDKGLLALRGKVWAEAIKEKFSAISIPSVLSINQAQAENYLFFFDQADLIVDNTDVPVHGPLKGLLSVHKAFPSYDLLVVACDMINLEALVLRNLLDEYNSSKVAAMAYQSERVEPMCAIYSSKGLKKLFSGYLQNELPSQSMMYVLEKLDAKYIAIPDGWKPFFKNYNAASDLP